MQSGSDNCCCSWCLSHLQLLQDLSLALLQLKRFSSLLLCLPATAAAAALLIGAWQRQYRGVASCYASSLRLLTAVDAVTVMVVSAAGGADWGLAEAVEEGSILGPRLLFTGEGGLEIWAVWHPLGLKPNPGAWAAV
jgi:hypothetical protein